MKQKLGFDVVGKVNVNHEGCFSECPHCNSVEFVKHDVIPKGIKY